MPRYTLGRAARHIVLVAMLCKLFLTNWGEDFFPIQVMLMAVCVFFLLPMFIISLILPRTDR